MAQGVRIIEVLLYTFLHPLHFPLHHASFLHNLSCLNEFSGLLGIWYIRYANHPFHVSEIPRYFPSIFCRCLSRLTLIYMISQLYLYPNRYSVVVLVGLIFTTIISYIRQFVTWAISKWHIIYNVTWALMIGLIYNVTLSHLRSKGVSVIQMWCITTTALQVVTT